MFSKKNDSRDYLGLLRSGANRSNSNLLESKDGIKRFGSRGNLW